jgi:peptide/nickel transport system substrate-binding protein
MSSRTPEVLTRRNALRLLAGGGIGIVAACTPAAPTTAPTTVPVSNTTPASTTAGQPASAAPKTGGTLRVAISADPASLDGHLYAAGRFDTTWLIYDRLTEYDVNLKPQPMLAESWDVSSDYKRIQLNLRKGVTFHDGREFTSDDVKYNFLRVRDPKVGAGAFVNQSNWFSSFDTPDKYTIVLNSEEPRPLVFDFFERLNMLDKNIMEGPDAKTKANGTGPFKFVEWVQGDHFTTEKNPNFWMSGRPYIDGVRTLILKDQQGAVAQLEAGAIDVFQNMNLIDFLRLRNDPRFTTIQGDVPTGMYCLGINCTWAPMDNKLVRQAVNWAINRKRWVDQYFSDTSAPISLEWYRGTPMYDAQRENYYTFDLDKARSLLAASGESLSAPSDFVFLTTEPPVGSQALAQILQSDLASIGVTLTLRSIEFATLADTMNNLKYTMAYDAVFRYGEFEPSTGMTTSSQYNYQKNFAGFTNDDYTQLITSSQTEADPARRQALYSQLNDLLLDQCFSMPLATNPPVIATTNKVHDVGWNAHDQLIHDQLWLG